MNAGSDDWIELLADSANGGDASQCKENGCLDGLKQEITEMNVDEKSPEPELEEGGEGGSSGLVNDGGGVDRFWGSVYQRKRKRTVVGCADFSGNSEKKRALAQRKFGIQFYRKQWRRRIRENPVAEAWHATADSVGLDVTQGCIKCRVLTAVVESSCTSSGFFASFLTLVFGYMRRARLRLAQLAAFLISEPLALVFSSSGIHFKQDSTSFRGPGVCKIFGARCLIPLFHMDFSVLPSYFMYLHSGTLLRSQYLPCLEIYSVIIDTNNDGRSDDQENLPCLSDTNSSGSRIIPAENGSSGKGKVSYQPAGAPRSTRAVQVKNGVSSRSIQKKRSSLRSRRVRHPSVFGTRKTKGALVSELFRRDVMQLSSVSSNRQLRSSVRRTTTTNIKELKSIPVELTMDLDSTPCKANILVIESDKCYRIKDASVTLEISDSKKWYLALKSDGIARYTLTAQKVMRPCSCNRVTHDKIWTEDHISSWKLEFPNKQDWLVFKELYRECFERNLQAPTDTTIHVPGVCEVSGDVYDGSVPFARPDSYIKAKDDELSRTLAKRSANYDMDTDDELWLNKFNSEFVSRNELPGCSEESFELIIDAFEKAVFCSPDDYSEEQGAVRLCQDLERREVVEAVHGYWMKKRKEKRSSLIRVFQLNQPRRSQVIPRSVLRKKRSFKRQSSKSVRGKQRAFLQVMATKKEPFDEEGALLKLQEAKAAAKKAEGVAVLKRQKAQLLMGNAELATYRATLALRIAEGTQIVESADAAASFFLD